MNDTTNGREISPSQKAWITAKDQAVAEHEVRQAENRERGQREQQEMIRAVMDPNLSHGAARLFCFLLKAGWIPDFGGLYLGRVGAVMTDGRRLARYCGGASVNCLYQKVRHEKRDASGKVLVHASVTDGWIAELVRGGYIWIGKHRIANIPKSHWPNVYNVACHVPEKVTPHLPWLDGGFGSENVINTTLDDGSSPRENSLSTAQNTPVNGQTPKSQPARHRNANLPVTATEDGQAPHRQLANHRNGGLPVTASDNGQSPHRITARHRNGGLPSTEKAVGPVGSAVDLGKTLDPKKVSKQTNGEPPPPALNVEGEFRQWERQVCQDANLSTLKKLDALFAGQLQTVRDEQARALVKRKLVAVRMRLHGPALPDKAPTRPITPVKLPAPARMPDHKLKAMGKELAKLKATL